MRPIVEYINNLAVLGGAWRRLAALGGAWWRFSNRISNKNGLKCLSLTFQISWTSNLRCFFCYIHCTTKTPMSRAWVTNSSTERPFSVAKRKQKVITLIETVQRNLKLHFYDQSYGSVWNKMWQKNILNLFDTKLVIRKKINLEKKYVSQFFWSTQIRKDVL